MILRGPTGLWRKVIPMKPEDTGSVTFTISNQNPPPPSNKLIPKLPDAVIARALPISQHQVLDDHDRRHLFGERIRSVVSGGRTYLRDGKKLFEPGEVVDFQEDTKSVDPRSVPDEVMINHGTNLLDMAGAGLTEEEIQQIENDAERARASLRDEMATKQGEVEDLRTQISSVQRQINETTKILNSLVAIYDLSGSVPSGNDKFDRLYQSRIDLNASQDALIEQVNTKNADLLILRDKLLRLSEVIR
jgi:hypothetical protein